MRSRFLVLVATPRSAASRWVELEWTAFMAEHGPVGRIVVVTLESVELPTFLKPVQQVDGTHRQVERVAAELVAIVGRAGELKEGDARALFIGQDLVFGLRLVEDQLEITDPTGQTRRVTPPWRVDRRFGVALLGFNQGTRQAITRDTERAELIGHARTLGGLLFELLFGTEDCRRLLDQAMIPGRPRPLVTLRSEEDLLLSLPWELVYHDDSFLVRDARIDMARSTGGAVGPGALLPEPGGYFKLVVNVSAPEGSGLDYEGESYRITRALSEHCELVPTELGTVENLLETVKRVGPTGIHFSGHGSPGRLQFEDDEGRSGSESSAASLHRAGVPQVVGYYGPIGDELSTQAEEALYAAIAEGHTTRYAVRQARAALSGPFWGPEQKVRLGEEPGEVAGAASPARDPDGAGMVSSHPFGWAQLVLYHRGPDRPLSRPIPAGVSRRLEQALRRTFQGTGERKILSAGFIGRRVEQHRIRRRLRRGDRVLVLQGLGGLGKTTLSFHTLPMLAGAKDVCTFWCREAEKEANPAETLVGQLLAYCRDRFGHQWEPVVQQVDRAAQEDSALRFAYFLQVLLLSLRSRAPYFYPDPVG